MKPLTMLVIAALAGYVGYVFWINDRKPPPAPEAAVTETTSIPGPAATPTITRSEPASVASIPELAPEGVFYLLAAARVEAADGIVGLPPGTGVKLVRTGVYLTPAGEVRLDANLLTNDMKKARAALEAGRAKQAAAKAAIAAYGEVVAKKTPATTPAQTIQAATEPPNDATKAQAEEERAAMIAEIREQITIARQRKASLQRVKPINWQAKFRDQEAEIRSLQNQLSRLGAGGAFLD